MSNLAIMRLIPFLRGHGFVFSPVISADVSNYNLRNAAIAAGWDGVSPLIATVTINSGIVVSANATNQYAFDTGTGFPAGSALALVNDGYIVGMGGAGAVNPTTLGAAGGPALRAQFATSITNNGTIAGGGGGGGKGTSSTGSGGGGRTGRTASAGYVSGTFATGGAGHHGGGGDGGAGGTTGPGGNGELGAGYYGGGGGGGWGAAGGRGALANTGGAGGAAVVGNAYITWTNTGTRYGSIT